jgi:hypothetical protein
MKFHKCDYRILASIVVSAAVVFSGCSGGGTGSEGGERGSSPAAVPTPNPTMPGWMSVSQTSPDGKVKYTQNQMTPQQQAQARQQYTRTNLEQLPVDAKYNATVFKIDGTSDYAQSAFIAPKLYVYSSADGGRLDPVINSDGTVTMSFNVVFIDGITSQIPNDEANGKLMDVPQDYLVKNPDELAAKLGLEFKDSNGIAPLPGCPKRLTLIVAGREYDATPSDLASGDYCQLNRPILVSLTVPKDEARYIFDEALYDSLVDVRGIYETRVSFPVVTADISFDREKIFSDLEAELAVFYPPYADMDMKSATTRVMQNQMMSVSIQGDTTAVLDKLVDQVVQEFFVTLKNDPATGTKECKGNAVVCFRLTDQSYRQTDTMSFHWNQSSNQVSGQNYLTWSKLQPLAEEAVVIGNADPSKENCANGPKCGRLVNDGAPVSTDLTVQSGNLLMIEPLYVNEETRPVTALNVQHVDNNVCLQWRDYYDGCHGSGHGGEEHCDHHHVCAQSQDQWVETDSYFLGTSQMETVQQPLGAFQEFTDALFVHLAWIDSKTGSKKSVDCPLSGFQRKADGKSLQVVLENTPTCQVFTENPHESPTLYLVSKISTQKPYMSGRLIKKWNGTVVQAPTNEMYIPEVDIAAMVSVRGYGFQGSNGVERN